MTDDFIWGGINIRKFCALFLRDFWMVIAIMIISYLGLSFVDKQTYTPRYISTAVLAVYPTSSSYRYHTIETAYGLASKTEDMSSVFKSDLFQSGFHNQDSSLQDCAIDCYPIANTDLIVMHANSSNPGNAFRGIRTVLDYYSQFSGDMTGAPEIKIILGPEEPYREANDSKIHRYRVVLSAFSGLMMAGLLLFVYAVSKTYKTERSIKRRYKNIRFFSLPFFKYKSVKKKHQESINKVALEIKQTLHKYNKKTLLVESCADEESGNAFLSVLATALAEQNEDVILMGTDVSDDAQKYTLLDVLQQNCTVKDAMIYREDLKAQYIQFGPDNSDDYVSYSIDDVRRVLTDCLEYADIVLINGSAWYPFRYAQIWNEAVDASIALCRQDDAGFFKVDKMLSDLQTGDTYFAGCVLVGF